MKIKTTIRGGLAAIRTGPIIGRGCGGSGSGGFPVLLRKTIEVK